MGGKGDPTLWMVRGADAIPLPGFGRNCNLFEKVPFPPPALPEFLGVFRCTAGKFPRIVWDESGDAQQTSLEILDGRSVVQGGVWMPSRFEFRQPTHRPGILFVTERSKKSLPECLVPAGGFGQGEEFVGLELEPDFGGLPQDFVERIRGEILQRCGAFPGDQRRTSRRIQKPLSKFLNGGIKAAFEGQGWNRARVGIGRGPGPDDVQNDPAVLWIFVMSMVQPSLGIEIDLDVARAGPSLPYLHNGLLKIRAGFTVPKSRVQHRDSFAAGTEQRIPFEPLMRPDHLQKLFRKWMARRILQKEGIHARTPPTGIATVRGDKHLAAFLNPGVKRVKSDDLL